MSTKMVYFIGLPGSGKTSLIQCLKSLTDDIDFVDRNYNRLKLRSHLSSDSKVVTFNANSQDLPSVDDENYQEMVHICCERTGKSIEDITSMFEPISNEEKYDIKCLNVKDSLHDMIQQLWSWIFADKPEPSSERIIEVVSDIVGICKYPKNSYKYGYFAALVDQTEMHKIIDIQKRFLTHEKFAENKGEDDEFHCTLHFIKKSEKIAGEVKCKSIIPHLNSTITLKVSGIGYNENICAVIVDPSSLSDYDIPFYGEKAHISLSRASKEISWADSTKMLQDENSTIVMFDESIEVNTCIKYIK